jgi:hypothetical protein
MRLIRKPVEPLCDGIGLGAKNFDQESGIAKLTRIPAAFVNSFRHRVYVATGDLRVLLGKSDRHQD